PFEIQRVDYTARSLDVVGIGSRGGVGYLLLAVDAISIAAARAGLGGDQLEPAFRLLPHFEQARLVRPVEEHEVNLTGGGRPNTEAHLSGACQFGPERHTVTAPQAHR